MDYDAPEPEMLNFEETMTCCRVQAVYLGRAPLGDDGIEPD